ncbi:MAG: DUF523 domain-containing protein [Clostridia bacterium]|nr:DUF523 domain-containing protein [Clostridia bacterium]
MYLISACLAGVHCRYDHSDKGIDKIKDLIKNQPSIIVCPEQIGGLTTPRPAAEISGGDGNDVLEGKARIINKAGEDVTDEFVKGALEALEIAEEYGVTKAILKGRSPSCGCGQIYDGTFSGKKIDGDGVLAALLKKSGIDVVTEDEFE